MSETNGKSVAYRNKAIRQEALREQLSAQGHVQHVVDLAGKLADLDTELDSVQTQRLKAAIDTKLKLIGKYLPDQKAVEVTTDDEGIKLVTEVKRTIVDPNANT